MSDEDYDKLPESFRKFKRELLKNNPELAAKLKKNRISKDHLKEIADKINLGDRCKIDSLSGHHLGTVKYVGPLEKQKPGYWIGVQLDEPYGKNNGTCMGHKYFECDEGYGIFIRPDKLMIGDFPEESLEDLLGFDDEI